MFAYFLITVCTYIALTLFVFLIVRWEASTIFTACRTSRTLVFTSEQPRTSVRPSTDMIRWVLTAVLEVTRAKGSREHTRRWHRLVFNDELNICFQQQQQTNAICISRHPGTNKTYWLHEDRTVKVQISQHFTTKSIAEDAI